QGLRQHPADRGRTVAALGGPRAPGHGRIERMRLELSWSVVDDLAAGSATRLAGRRLEVDVDGLRALLSADPRLTGIRLDLVHPGERCRLGRVFDVSAPRARSWTAARISPACSAAWPEPVRERPSRSMVSPSSPPISRPTTSVRSR